MPKKPAKKATRNAVQNAAPMPPVSAAVVRWYEEVKEADDVEEVARRAAFDRKWIAEAKADGRRAPTATSQACNQAWRKAQGTFSLTDGDWLRARHQVAHYPAWLSNSQSDLDKRLPAELPFDRANFTLAALNCGYGASGVELAGQAGQRTGVWLDDAFAECMHLRTSFLLSTIDFAAVKLQPFMSLFETSERADVSFLIGSATAYLVADAWLAVGGRKLKSFWHVGMYCAALVEGDRGTAFKNTDIYANEKAPDFLAVDDKDEVHLFESKGGRASKNNEVLRRALGQLASVMKVSLYNLNVPSTRAKVTTRMAVRTVVEPDCRFELLAYDPPAAAAGTHLRIEFNVARGLQTLESERLFENLQSPARQLDYELQVREVEGTHLVMCCTAPYRELRCKLHAYLAVRQALPAGAVAPAVSSDSGSGEPVWRRLAHEHGSSALADHDDAVQKQFDQALAAAEAPGALLPELSRSLGIPALMAAFDSAIEAAQMQLLLWGDTTFKVRVLPGLLIQLVDWDGDMRRRSVRPSGPRKKI